MNETKIANMRERGDFEKSSDMIRHIRIKDDANIILAVGIDDLELSEDT